MNKVFETFGQVREAGAIIRADGVDAALIGLQVQKLAGRPFIDQVFVAVSFLFQPFAGKGFGRHFKVGRDALQVPLVEGRGHRFAAVGTGKAVDLLPHLFFQSGYAAVEATGAFFIQAGKIAAHTRFLVTGFGFEGTEINRRLFFHGAEDNDSGGSSAGQKNFRADTGNGYFCLTKKLIV